MNKLNQLSISLAHPSDVELDRAVSWLDPDRLHNLIVLVPANSNCTAVTRRICNIAKETNSCIQLLGLYKDTNEELTLRRELATASALIRDAKVYAEIIVEKGTNWVEAIKHNYQAGDMIVCITEQSMGIQRKPLSEILESNFKAPVYMLSKIPAEQSKSNLLKTVTAWSSLIALIVGFFFAQVKITQLTNGGFQTLLLILFLLLELWLIQAWNSLFF